LRGAWAIPYSHSDSSSQSLSQSLHVQGTGQGGSSTGIGIKLEPLSFDPRTVSSYTNERTRADSSTSPITPGGSQSVPRLMGYSGEPERPGTTGSERAWPGVLRPGSGSGSASSMPMSAGLGSFAGMGMGMGMTPQAVDMARHQQQEGQSRSSYHTGQSRRPESPSRYPSHPALWAPFPSSSSPRYVAQHLPPILPPLQEPHNPTHPPFGYPQHYADPGPSSLPDRLSQPTLDHPHYHRNSHAQEDQYMDTSGISVFGHPEYTSVIPSASRKRLTGKSNTPAACSACKKWVIAL
jgi:hypothetical protein